MRALDSIKDLLTTLARILPAPRSQAFTCGDCEQTDRCGRPPSDACITKAAQIARDGGRPPRRPTLLEC